MTNYSRELTNNFPTNACIGRVTVKNPIYETLKKRFVYIRGTFDFNVLKPIFCNQIVGS